MHSFLSLFKKTASKILTGFLLIAIIAPSFAILVSPEYAFAQAGSTFGNNPNQISSGRQGSQGTAQQQAARSGSLTSAAAGGAASIGTCLATAGISVAGVLGALGLGSAAMQAVGTAAGVALSVPVFDVSNKMDNFQIITANMTLTGKETIIDCLAWAIAKAIWRAIAADIIDWINSGFNGSPAFVTDFKRFFGRVADEEIGRVIEGSALAFLCSPFQLQIRIAIAQRYLRRAPSCTLSQVVANLQGFFGNFKQGGWDSWLGITTIPQNNIFGSYLIGEASTGAAVSIRLGNAERELNFGRGFLSAKRPVNCREVVTQEDAYQVCDEEIVTPGQLIGEQASQITGSTQAQLLIADELNEIIDALIGALLSQALQSFSGLSSSSSYQDTYYNVPSFTEELRTSGTDFSTTTRQTIETLDNARLTEENFITLQEDSINRIQSEIDALEALGLCWDSKADRNRDGSDLTEDERLTASRNGQTARLGKLPLTEKQRPFRTEIARSEQNIAIIDEYIERAGTLTNDAIAIGNLLTEFYLQRTNNVFATDYSINLAEQAYAQVSGEMATQAQSTGSELVRCQAFPRTE